MYFNAAARMLRTARGTSGTCSSTSVDAIRSNFRSVASFTFQTENSHIIDAKFPCSRHSSMIVWVTLGDYICQRKRDVRKLDRACEFREFVTSAHYADRIHIIRNSRQIIAKVKIA